MNTIENNIEQFKRRGITCFRNVLAANEIQELIAIVDSILINPNYKPDLLSIDNSNGIHKILYPLGKDERLLKYIVHPLILEVLISLVSDVTEIVLTWEDILIKEPFTGIPVTFHQDLALQSTDHDIFSFGMYFHDSVDNPVYYLPESFKYGALTKDKLYKVVAEHKDQFEPIIACAGDISLHYVKTIHYSDTNRSPNPRYTWYLEYRTMTQLRENSPWDEEWIIMRRAIFVAALMRYAPAYVERLAPDLEKLKPYLQKLELRVPQTNDKIQYDMESPYNHFA